MSRHVLAALLTAVGRLWLKGADLGAQLAKANNNRTLDVDQTNIRFGLEPY
jgi:hypothetical protein